MHGALCRPTTRAQARGASVVRQPVTSRQTEGAAPKAFGVGWRALSGSRSAEMFVQLIISQISAAT